MIFLKYRTSTTSPALILSLSKDGRATGVKALLLLSLLSFPLGPARAHDAPSDKLGCHHVTGSGVYHCHQGALAGQAFTSKREAMERIEANVETSAWRWPAFIGRLWANLWGEATPSGGD